MTTETPDYKFLGIQNTGHDQPGLALFNDKVTKTTFGVPGTAPSHELIMEHCQECRKRFEQQP